MSKVKCPLCGKDAEQFHMMGAQITSCECVAAMGKDAVAVDFSKLTRWYDQHAEMAAMIAEPSVTITLNGQPREAKQIAPGVYQAELTQADTSVAQIVGEVVERTAIEKVKEKMNAKYTRARIERLGREAAKRARIKLVNLDGVVAFYQALVDSVRFYADVPGEEKPFIEVDAVELQAADDAVIDRLAKMWSDSHATRLRELQKNARAAERNQVMIDTSMWDD